MGLPCRGCRVWVTGPLLALQRWKPPAACGCKCLQKKPGCIGVIGQAELRSPPVPEGPHPMDQQRSPFLIETKLAISIRPLPRRGQHRERPPDPTESGGRAQRVERVERVEAVEAEPPWPRCLTNPFLPLPPLSGDLGTSTRGRGALIVHSLQGLACGSCAFLLRTLASRCNSKT